MTNYQSYSVNTSNYAFQDENVKFENIPVMKSNGRFLDGDYYPLPHSYDRERRILRYLEMELPIYQILNIARDLTPEELNQLHYLLLSIEAYYKQQNAVIPRHELIYLVINSKGLKILKRMKFKSFLESNHGTLMEKPDWYDQIKSYHIYDIGEIFNFNYGFFWMEEDTQDYLLSKIPVEIDSDILKGFKKVVERIINNCVDFEKVLPEEVLLRVNASSSIDEGLNSFPNYHLKSKYLQFSSIRTKGKRCLITPSPGSGRDAIINNVYDLNSIQLINENIRAFLKVNFPKFILTSSHDQNLRRYISRCNKNNFFYCRDIRKEGLTKPKYICKIVLEALQRRFPENKAFGFPSFYSGPWYENDTSERGHGLGMANELTTLIQILIFFTVNYFIGKGGDYVVSSKAFFLNDDSIFFINGTDEDIECFVDYDNQVCSGLGILVQKDKSFFSDSCAIFCEMYYSRGKPYVNDKISYKVRETEIMKRCSNILEAKMYAGNMKGTLSEIEDILKIVYIHLGYEFNKDEINWPITLGGLRPFKLLGVDFTLNYVRSYSDIKLLFRAYAANKERRLKRRNKYLKEYIPPIAKLYPGVLKETDKDILERIGLGSESNLSSIFFRPSKEGKLHWALNKLYAKRQKIFNETLSSPTYEDFCRIYASESSSNVLLEDIFVERFIPVKIFAYKGFKDPYMIINPMMSYINYKCNLSHKYPKTQWGLFQQNCILSAEKSVFARTRAQNTLSLIDRFDEDFEAELLVFPENPDDIEDFMESYPKPFLTYSLVRNGNLLPIPKKPFRNPQLKMRKEVFGKYLNLREIYLSQTNDWYKMCFILEFERCFKNMIEFDNDFWDCVEHRAQEAEIHEKTFSKEKVDSEEEHMYDMRMTLDTYGVTVIDNTSSTNDAEEVVEELPPGGIFMQSYGPLPEGDISVYGSQEWLLWFFNLERWEQDPILEADPDLSYASVDTLAFVRGVVPGSDAFKEKNEVLEANLIHSSNLSWVAWVFHNVFRNIKPPEDEELDTSTLFEF